MVERRTFVIELGKYSLIRDIVNNGMDGKLLNVPDRQYNMEFYHIGLTECSLFHDGENVIIIGGNSIDSIIKTKLELEKSGVELRNC